MTQDSRGRHHLKERERERGKHSSISVSLLLGVRSFDLTLLDLSKQYGVPSHPCQVERPDTHCPRRVS